MWRTIGTSLLVLFVSGRAHASGWADALFEELSRDFGSVPRGQQVVHPFRLVNKTRERVVISSVRVSCGLCSTAKALQSTLEPGQETAILVTLDTRRFANTKNITVYVQFSRPNFEEVRLWVQANSRDDVAFEPEGLHFGKIKRGDPAKSGLNVSFLGTSQTHIQEVKCDSNYIKLAVREVRRETGEVTYRVEAEVRPDAPAGKWYTDVWLKTDHAAMPRLRIPLTVEIEGPLSVTPATVSLGKVQAGGETDRKVILRGIRPFRIVEIAGTDDQIRIRQTSTESRTVHVLTVTLTPRQPGELNRIIRIRTDLEAGGDIAFNAQARIEP